jgi:Ca2+-transporting ATPase
MKLSTPGNERRAAAPGVQAHAPAAGSGLAEDEARARLRRDGANELPQAHRRGGWRLLRDITTEPMFLLLVACGAIYMALGDRHEAAMLLAFVVIVMVTTFVQQRRSERSLDALRDLSSPQAQVLRDGGVRRLSGRELVCGDIVLLAEGDRVPADLRLVEASNLEVDESMLTGESAPVVKGVGPDAGDAALAFSGTLVTQGTARGEVVATGVRSALGRVGESLQALGDAATPIQRETRQVVTRVAIVGLLLAAALATAYAFRNGDWLQGLLAGLTFAMAVLPEELPVVMTLFLGLGAWRLAREKVLARSIPAIELLGATTVLCVDKTGTLTANRMSVRRLWSGSALHPMESAIGDAGRRLLADTEHLHGDWALQDDYPLSRELLAMSRVWRSPARREQVIAAKGAPEAIVDLCHLDAARHAVVATQVAAMAAEGLRVLGVARATFEPGELPRHQHDFDFEFLGLVALEDPLREDVPDAIAQCRAAGIRVVMVTGDHPSTALSIARQAGLSTGGRAVTGTELAGMDDATLAERLADTRVFCRVLPEQKLRLVRAFRARGEIVAMTGDGVNDAPALKAAHIGVAMGARGTDVAREAAALVLTDDDFASLVTAVRHGRRVFANLRKAMAFVVAVHVPIVGLSILPVLFGWPMLLMPVHVLFLQLIIDPACSVVFEAEPAEPDAMRSPPRRADTRLFDRAVLLRGLWQGAGLLALLLAVHAVTRTVAHADDVARALTFGVLVLASLGLIFVNRRWAGNTLLARGGPNRAFGWIVGATLLLLGTILAVPAVARLFAFAAPGPTLLGAGAGVVLLSLVWFELVKWVLQRGRPEGSPAAAGPPSR